MMDKVILIAKRIYVTLLYLSTLVIVILALYCLYVWIFPINVVSYTYPRQKVLNANHIVKAGTQVNIVITMCKYYNFPTDSVTTHLVDGVSLDLDVSYNPVGVGCHETPVSILIPKNINIEEGISVRIKRDFKFRESPFTVKESGWVSEDFYIVP